MTNKPIQSVLRLRKRHTPRNVVELGAEDGKRLVDLQSLRDALVASLIVVILFSILWAMLSTLTSRIFPWMTIVLGISIGLVIRRAGRGVDWRFPALAAGVTLFGAIAGNVVVAAAFTAAALDTSTLEVLGAVTSMTWPVFFEEVISAADIVYAIFAAATAAFYANKRLSRGEYLALRKWREREEVGPG